MTADNNTMHAMRDVNSLRDFSAPGNLAYFAPDAGHEHARGNLEHLPAGPGIPASTMAWGLPVFTGLLGEISGVHAAASLTFAFRLVHDAQQRQEPVAWIHLDDRIFFPPDVADAGVDLDALAVIRAPALLQAARAADHLLRSGGFGLVVLDVGAGARMSIPVQSRLAGLARKHDAAFVCLTEKDRHRASLGPLVSLRVETERRKKLGDRFQCEALVLKDKRHGPGRTCVEVCRGPAGLC